METARRRGLLGFGALFSGAALVIHILSKISLTLLFGLTVSLLVCTVWIIRRQTSRDEQRNLLRLVTLGFIAGLISTIAYDSSKFILSQWDPSPYNPFEAIRIFGVHLIGPDASIDMIQIAGLGFHIVNGLSFGISYCLLFSRRGNILTGIGWGLFLELFQLTLFPGWLNVGFYSEFVQISALSHIVYGAVLGSICLYGMRQLDLRNYQTHNPDESLKGS